MVDHSLLTLWDQCPGDSSGFLSIIMRVFMKGIRLGKQLKEIRHHMRWKVLADFWTEMILYIAPSDNAKAHIEHLANGGEFLTHLWALIFHTGIVNRDEFSHDIENAATD